MKDIHQESYLIYLKNKISMALEGYPIPTKEDSFYLTVRELKKYIADLPDDSKIFVERIEDYYFKPGDGWIEHSKYKPNWLGGSPAPQTEKVQFIRIYSPIKYPKDKNLYLTAHY